MNERDRYKERERERSEVKESWGRERGGEIMGPSYALMKIVISSNTAAAAAASQLHSF